MKHSRRHRLVPSRSSPPAAATGRTPTSSSRTPSPQKEDLQLKLPDNAANQAGLSGIAQRQDALVVGESSKLANDAINGSKAFNSWLDGLLAVIEAVRNYPPTLREPAAASGAPTPTRSIPASRCAW